MAIIYTYPLMQQTVVADDLLLMTDISDDKKTKSVKISALPFTNNTGTVTSVALTMPAAFAVANSPITTAGTLAVTPTGGASGQYLDYTGNWSTPAGGAANPAGLDTQVQYNDGGSSFGAGAFFTTNKSNKVDIAYELGLKGDGGSNQGLLKLYCEAGTAHHVGIKGPNHTGGTPASYTIQLPNSLPNVANQILESNASGTLSWIPTPSGGGYTLPLATSSIRGGVKIGYVQNAKNYPVQLLNEQMFVNVPWTDTATSPNGLNTQIQYNNNGSFGGSSNFTYTDSTRILNIGDQDVNRGIVNIAGGSSGAGELRLGDDGTSGNYITLKSAADVGNPYNIVLPGGAPGGVKKILESDANGNLSWINTPTGGGISFSGSTANGIATYSNASTANVSSNLTIDNANKKLSVGSTYSIQDSSGVFKIGSLSSTQAQESIEFHINGAQKVKVNEDGRLVASVGSAANPNLKLGTGNDGIYGTTNTVQLITNGTSKINISDGNTADIQMNDLVEFGYGLRFGATGETLSSYEEGTWTPTAYAPAGNAPTVTGAAGTYVNIGKMVIVNFYMTITSYSQYNVNMVISGLPYAAGTANGSFGGVSLYSNNGQTYIQQQPTSGYVNGSNIYLMRPTSTSNPVLVNASWYAQAAFAGNYTIAGTATYKQA